MIPAITPMALTALLLVNGAAPDTDSRNGLVLGKLIYTDLDVGFQERPLSEVTTFIADACDVKIRLLARSPHRAEGIDRDTPITLPTAVRPALNLLQDAIEQCGQPGSCAWQLRNGVVEVSTKEALSAEPMQLTRVLPVEDLLQPVPDYNDPPNLNLGGGTGGGGGSGGGGGGGLQGGGMGIEDLETRRNRLIEVMIRNIEPGAWKRSGGTWASIQPYERSLVIRAPRWIQRQVFGLPFRITIPKGRSTRELQFIGSQIRVLIPLSERLRAEYGDHS